MKTKMTMVFMAASLMLLTSVPVPPASAVTGAASYGFPTNFEGTEPDLKCNETVATCCNNTAKTGANPLRGAVSCRFTCGVGALLAIEATSSDGAPFSVDVWGNVDCASQEAECVRDQKKCVGATAEPTTQSGEGDCWANSDDAWASETTVVCVATIPPIPCTFGELRPSMEEVVSCAFLITCQVQPIDSNGHYYGLSLCEYEDENGENYQYLCVYQYANENCTDLSNAALAPFFPGSKNLNPDGELFSELINAFVETPPNPFVDRIIKIRQGGFESEIKCIGLACVEYSSK